MVPPRLFFGGTLARTVAAAKDPGMVPMLDLRISREKEQRLEEALVYSMNRDACQST